MANTFSDLTATTVAANYKKVSGSTQLGTRVLRMIKVTVGGGAGDLTVGYNADVLASTGNSSYAQAVNALQGYAELYAVYAPSSTAFVALVSDDTAQDSDTGTNVAGGWGDAEANIVAALGGTCAITTGTWTGGSVSFS